VAAKKKSAKSGKKRAYHHGDLRAVLLEASLALIEKEGIAALSLREVARRAKVTHGAPYHHFPDRSALLATIAEDGFRRLGEALSGAVGAARDPGARYFACGVAYVDFAVRHRGYFQVMFRPELAPPDLYPAVGEASTAAFDVLVRVIEECQRANVAPPGDPFAMAVTSWAMAHGLAALSVEGPLAHGMPGLGENPHDIATIAVETLRGWLTAAGRARLT